MNNNSLSQRRSFFARAGAGFASLAAASGVVFPGKALAKQKTAPTGLKAARHEKDDWLDKLPGKHRLVFDTTTFNGFGEALLYANNFIVANKMDYGVDSNELAIVIIARHGSTPFAFNVAMWAKYGKALAEMSPVQDPHTKEGADDEHLQRDGLWHGASELLSDWFQHSDPYQARCAICGMRHGHAWLRRRSGQTNG